MRVTLAFVVAAAALGSAPTPAEARRGRGEVRNDGADRADQDRSDRDDRDDGDDRDDRDTPRRTRSRDDGTHLGVRIGGATLALSPGADTPVLGGYFTRAVDAYNGAAAAYNASHGLSPSATAGAPSMTHGDLALTSDLVLVTPSLDVGGDGWFFRLDAPLGFGEGVRTYGLGLYPIAWAGALGPSGAALYVVAGASASYATFTDHADAHGALVQGRAALGLRFASDDGWRLGVEVGFGLFALGGIVDFARLSTLEAYDPRGMAPPPSPDEITRGGEQRGMLDLAVTVALP